MNNEPKGAFPPCGHAARLCRLRPSTKSIISCSLRSYIDTQHPFCMSLFRAAQSSRGVHIQQAARTSTLLFDRYPGTKGSQFVLFIHLYSSHPSTSGIYHSARAHGYSPGTRSLEHTSFPCRPLLGRQSALVWGAALFGVGSVDKILSKRQDCTTVDIVKFQRGHYMKSVFQLSILSSRGYKAILVRMAKTKMCEHA